MYVLQVRTCIKQLCTRQTYHMLSFVVEEDGLVTLANEECDEHFTGQKISREKTFTVRY
jgi:hypothetical protein